MVIKLNAIDDSKLVKDKKIPKTEYKIPNHDKYITTPELNKFSGKKFDKKLNKTKLVTKSDIANFIKNIYFDTKRRNIHYKIISNKAKQARAENKVNSYIHFIHD